MVASGATPVVPSLSSLAAITLATSVPWELVGVATAASQPLARQRQRSATRSPRSRSLDSSTPVVAGSSGIGSRTPVSTTATVRSAPRWPSSWASTTLAPGRGWRCQQTAGSQPSTRRTQSGSANATPGRPVSRRAAARTSAPRASSTTRVRPVPASTRPLTAAAAACRPCSPAPASNPTSTRPGTNDPAPGPAAEPAAEPPAEPATEPAPAGLGPLTGRVVEPGGGVLGLSTAPPGPLPTAPAGAAPAATGSTDSASARSNMRASEIRPGKPMGAGVLVRVEVRS
jgi:hypothetical protein